MWGALGRKGQARSVQSLEQSPMGGGIGGQIWVGSREGCPQWGALWPCVGVLGRQAGVRGKGGSRGSKACVQGLVPDRRAAGAAPRSREGALPAPGPRTARLAAQPLGASPQVLPVVPPGAQRPLSRAQASLPPSARAARAHRRMSAPRGSRPGQPKPGQWAWSTQVWAGPGPGSGRLGGRLGRPFTRPGLGTYPSFWSVWEGFLAEGAFKAGSEDSDHPTAGEHED